jgi:cob(I)alamin adenosyltransferase
MSKIYTKNGDTGNTILASGEEVTKDCVSLRVVGEMDELNCILGITISTINEPGNLSRLLEMLVSIQRDLFLAGSEISALQTVIPTTKEESLSVVIQSVAKDPSNYIESIKITALENYIDAMHAELPKLTNFIIPAGHPIAAHLHLARAVCRRLERELVSLGKIKSVRKELYQYFNRLSDWLFVVARWVNFASDTKEVEVK